MSAISSLNIWLHHLYTMSGSPFFAGNSELTIPAFGSQLINCIYLVGLTTGLKFFKDSMQQRQRIQEQEKQQIALELNFLKAQVHPHFFFNTLNNLYSLTLQRSDQAPEVVLKLSSLMSYMLYESGAPYVPLDKEITNLENYIALEQLRFGKRLSLSFEKEVIPPDEPIRIPPLILLTFIENSFKHGMSQTIGDGRIDISLKADQQELFFQINNSIGETQPSGNGLGLKNVIRRLDLLYGSNYHLHKSQTAGEFQITLKIPLS
jgi:LytS/YehU family sensor histidine kinase